MARSYQYVGPPEIARAVETTMSPRVEVTSEDDVRTWIAATGQSCDTSGGVTATFIVDTEKRLWIADRRSEHVACARGGDVLSAGEMSFKVSKDEVEAICVTNQSTGYCPSPDSWPAVEQALDRAGIFHQGDFSVRLQLI